jgi:hypothetical protein
MNIRGILDRATADETEELTSLALTEYLIEDAVYRIIEQWIKQDTDRRDELLAHLEEGPTPQQGASK